MRILQFRIVIQTLLLVQLAQASAEQSVQGMSVLSQSVTWKEEGVNIP